MLVFLRRALLLLTEAVYPWHALGLRDGRCVLNAPGVNSDGSSVLASGVGRKGAKLEAAAQVMWAISPASSARLFREFLHH